MTNPTHAQWLKVFWYSQQLGRIVCCTRYIEETTEGPLLGVPYITNLHGSFLWRRFRIIERLPPAKLS
jgi:hypothetical protein